MKHPYLILAIILMVTLLLIFDRLELKDKRKQADTGLEGRSDGVLPGGENLNDKLIVVEDIDEGDLIKFVRDFFDLYRNPNYSFVPVLTKMEERAFAIRFPYDIDFETYCRFVHYLNCPPGDDRHFNATGWTIARDTDARITRRIADKPIMLFVAESDHEDDTISLTTVENIGYELDFGGEKRQLDHPGKSYHQPPVTIGALAHKPHIEVFYS
ncbi:hypothetical protein [Niabella aurantiaca]|uniref:hypothetical protein n=1 Tax=Niabella aurantiaca TaxID=379900 RepID=UPI000477F8D8|nr:hypothetical protein [Niabella aurantiaca]